MDVRAFTSEFLSFLELEEARLLTWGFIDVSLTSDEIEELFESQASAELINCWRKLQMKGWDMRRLLGELEQAGLLYRARPGDEVYRSRFAEGVRLIARLRQMFQPKDWLSGPPLVSDFKLHLGPRRYPVRDQSAEECWKGLEAYCIAPDLQKDAFYALAINREGKPLEFAAFQRKSFSHLLSRYGKKGVDGSVISAGTGSGKTKAFYIPAFLGVVSDLRRDPSLFTKIIAIYPRNVLLADQLREALSEADKLRPVLKRHGLRMLTFGALLGSTPEPDWFTENAKGEYYAVKNGWQRRGNGWVVPFLKSPISPTQDLIWRDSDRVSGSTALYRAGGDAAAPDIPDGVLILTREQLKAHPPDVLFLSAEMLNREMGNPGWARTFGMRLKDQAPRLLLLDEVHAYEGTSGAQVAWVLRRWRYWSWVSGLHVVGLSATLKEAQKHVGAVAGIPATSIQEFRPSEKELKVEGMEYNLAVKGDPSSGASLLATSIQTGMLLTRLLTPRNQPHPTTEDAVDGGDFFGRKVFGFTDSLDSLNRWYSDMYDAERNRRLAKLRLHPNRHVPPLALSQSVLRRMNEAGQIWELPSKLGHDLKQSLVVTRCSSQDPGANAGSDMIVASSSLEVGFDDPEVGAVLHHKKPISMSSFIQRKGRAGRRLGTRPLTVVVLSDFGGDRWTFQHAERLFQPEIDKIFLPITNPYVLRIQATYFLIDWLGKRIKAGSPFSYLTKPWRNSAAQGRAVALLKELIEQGSAWAEFRKDFNRLFGRPYGRGGRYLNEGELDSILWHAPRPLLRHVIPTLLRKLQARWSLAEPSHSEDVEDRGTNRPLPQYLPAATFSELGTGETRLIFEERPDRDDTYLQVSRALFESCPGRVSKRYSIDTGEEGYWLAFSDRLVQGDGVQFAGVEDLFPNKLLLGVKNERQIFQPITATLKHKPAEVLDTSNAEWNWASDFRPVAAGRLLHIWGEKPWVGIVADSRVFLHKDHSGVEVTRSASSCRYEVRKKRGESRRGTLRLRAEHEDGTVSNEAVGFQLNADGIYFKLSGEFIRSNSDLDAETLSRFRPEYFLHRVKTCDRLDEFVNSFQAEWLWQTSMAMLAATALRRRCSLQHAQVHLDGIRPKAAKRVFDNIFRVGDGGQEDEEGELRRVKEVVELWGDPNIIGRMEELERTLWESPSEDFLNWTRQRLVATLAQGFRAAIVSRQAAVAEEDLTVDVSWVDAGDAEVYLTERGAGGLGQLEAVVTDLRQSPEKMLEGLRHTLGFCLREHTTTNLLNILGRAVSGPETNSLRQAFNLVRSAHGFSGLEEAKEDLLNALRESGLPSDRAIVVAILFRILRAGSNRRTDVLVHLLNKAWARKSNELGVEIDSRVFSYLCVQYQPLKRRLVKLFRQISGGVEPRDDQLYSNVQQFLSPGCKDSCPECLDNPNRYNNFGKPSRALALRWLNLDVQEVVVEKNDETWLASVREELLREGRVIVSTQDTNLPPVVSALQGLLAEELESEFLLHTVAITGVGKRDKYWTISLRLRDVPHEP